MSHSHHKHNHQETGSIKTAFFLNLAFALLEMAGGIWINSLAVISDALHDFGDSLALGLSWYLSALSEREYDQTFSYGYRRFSLLGALINAIILIVGTVFVLSRAIPRLLHPEPVNAQGMLVFAILGVIINGVAALRMRGHDTLNAKMVTWHLLEDVLGWIVVLVVSVILVFWDLYILDPLLSILLAAYVSYKVLGNLREVLTLFLQAVPGRMSIGELENQLVAMDHVNAVHHTHVWSLDGVHHVLTAHVVVDENTTREQVFKIKCIFRTLIAHLDVAHSTIEIEYTGEQCGLEDASLVPDPVN
jgi:cobalt-zinc-cadmium efflux system protein